MSKIILSDPVTVANNINVKIKPNSVELDFGTGERVVRMQSAGGGAKELVAGKNVETEIPGFKLTLEPTEENIEFARTWARNFDENTFSFLEGDKSFTCKRVVLMTSVIVGLAAEGEIPLEFKCETIT